MLRFIIPALQSKKLEAGRLHNQQMLDKRMSDLVMAFPGGARTRDMISRAKKADVKVFEIHPIDHG